MIELSDDQAARIAQKTREILNRLVAGEGPVVAREISKALFFEHTKRPALRAHGLSVEASMAAYANKLEEDELAFRTAGLLHDLDYEKHPVPTEHPFVAAELLLERDYPATVIEAVLGHAAYTGVKRTTALSKTLFAVDELTGFLTAVAYVRPNGLTGLTFKSFKKKFKTPSFAAAVDRNEILQGAEELGVDFPEHVLFVAQALQEEFPAFPQLDELVE